MTATKLPALSEAAWQQQVTDLADWKGWAWLHLRPGRTVTGWRTPISGPLGAGWPDLLLARRERLVALELKSARGRVTAEQAAVLAALAAAGAETLVARPADWGRVQEVLA